MKKNTVQTVDSLCEEYDGIVARYKANIEEIEKKISECDQIIEKCNLEINNDISSLTPEEYISIQTSINNATLTKEMHEKKLSVAKGSFGGFPNAEERDDFIKRLMASYKAEEDDFIKECDIHLQALDVLLRERINSASKSVGLSQKIGTYTLLAPSNVRQIVSRAVTSRQNVGSYKN